MVIDFESKVLKVPEKLATICNANTAMVYAVLLASSDDNGITQISKNEIAYRAGIASKSVQRIIRKLEDMSIVECQYNIGYATTYHVTNILPAAQPEVRAAEQEEVPAEPAEPARQSEQRPELKPEYKYYGEYGWIALTDKEYADLVSEYGKRTIDNTISEIDNNREANKQYLPSTVRPGAYGKAYIKDWLRKDEKRKNKGKKDIIREQETREVDKYLDLVN